MFDRVVKVSNGARTVEDVLIKVVFLRRARLVRVADQAHEADVDVRPQSAACHDAMRRRSRERERDSIKLFLFHSILT